MKNYSGKVKKIKTPWGLAQQMTIITPGMTKISTSSHGGYRLTSRLNLRVPLEVQESTFGGLGKEGWYEEDVDWAIVVCVFSQHFTADELSVAKSTLRDNNEKAWKHLDF